MAKRSLDPETMNTRVLDRGAMKADLVGGTVGGAVGGLATGGAHLAQSGRVASVQMESAVARAAAVEDRSLAALARATEKKAASVIQEVARNSEAVGGVVGSSTAEGLAGTVNQPGDRGLRARHRHKETHEY
ncbi:hypothetical protein D6833_03040 [Candidatus Parcubacteria bacterium]|nr:MAG: hypothetical protein D6833_03040 [Candidatus Parcubacteria bacterium]